MTFSFDEQFEAFTGSPPFPWQRALFERFLEDRSDNIPASCNLPTGLGKTSVVAIWLLALIHQPQKMPRRLVYVVNRRTVVDQTTTEVERIQRRLQRDDREDDVKLTPAQKAILEELDSQLRQLCPHQIEVPLGISTMRGQLADNRKWSADPSRPAIIIGTVDMIGSRLLFSGYGVGFKARPLHAGFLGQDALLVHDEAHLEPAFQRLIESIEIQQTAGELHAEVFWPKLRVMALSATTRGDADPFELTDDEKSPPPEWPEPPTKPLHHVWRRLKAKKGLRFHPASRNAIAKTIGEMARDRWKNSNQAILIFVRTIDDVQTVVQTLTEKKTGVAKEQVQMLTGTMRGHERDKLAASDRVFARFLPTPKVDPLPGTVYFVCTSAGEVGVDISADHMVCDLSTLDSMAQRLGRVNRRGGGTSQIDVIYESDPDPKPKMPELEEARWRTREILNQLPACDWIDDRLDVSPLSLKNSPVPLKERLKAFTPEPEYLPATDLLFDAWSLTTLRERLPGRPAVEPYLHGKLEWEPEETQVAWREEVETIRGDLLRRYPPDELLENYPLLPREFLRDRSDRVFKHLTPLAERHPDAPVWLSSDDGTLDTHYTLREIVDKDHRDRIENRTVILSPKVGGLKDGLLDGSATETDLDVSQTPLRMRVWLEEVEAETLNSRTKEMRRICRIVVPKNPEESDDGENRIWEWYEKLESTGLGATTSKLPVAWHVHNRDVDEEIARILHGLSLPKTLTTAIKMAAKYHDYGKNRPLFQTMLGNRNPDVLWAKSGRTGGRIAEQYRHEFGSLFDVQGSAEFQQLDDEQRDLVLHMIAAHHGRARPHFSTDEAYDPRALDADSTALAHEIPRRFVRLQRRYGRWGLAFLESLLRAADYAASAQPSEFLEKQP
ncbi:MAG: type I-U CRISPR-associated helicase/endonuclease Cas3 [Planctomycetaceae bacterium]|nr:type I-U CRISPR-associated helicase/endonuclease Cas3 [Planctomycetaceae bacterium]